MKGKGNGVALMILEKAKGKDAEGSMDDDREKAREDLAKRASEAMKSGDGAALLEVIGDMHAVEAE
jgi:hypothetical protein|tara:strand:+ start:746 stop:943 length:198 start_codon:yes stop_codon:yes gene_type:complete